MNFIAGDPVPRLIVMVGMIGTFPTMMLECGHQFTGTWAAGRQVGELFTCIHCNVTIEVAPEKRSKKARSSTEAVEEAQPRLFE